MFPGKRWIAGRVAEGLLELARVHACEGGRVERPQPPPDLERPGERLLHGHLLVEHEPDQ